ncbi:MAG: hypothetical protein ABH814_02730 [bacterium]
MKMGVKSKLALIVALAVANFFGLTYILQGQTNELTLMIFLQIIEGIGTVMITWDIFSKVPNKTRGGMATVFAVMTGLAFLCHAMMFGWPILRIAGILGCIVFVLGKLAERK